MKRDVELSSTRRDSMRTDCTIAVIDGMMAAQSVAISPRLMTSSSVIPPCELPS